MRRRGAGISDVDGDRRQSTAYATPTVFDVNLIVIRAAVPRISDRETLSLARLDSDMMLASLPHLIADVKAHPRWFAKDMARCQAKTDADPSLLQGYRPLA